MDGDETVNRDQAEPIAEKVLAIWRDVLDNSTCKADDDFLDAGGDSLAAMLCIARIHEELGVEVEFENFFIEPATARGLAALIVDAQKSTGH